MQQDDYLNVLCELACLYLIILEIINVSVDLFFYLENKAYIVKDLYLFYLFATYVILLTFLTYNR